MARKRSENPPKHKDIVAYWSKKEAHSCRPMVLDAGEPACFACGWSGWDGWDTWSKLERAHIVAWQHDGPNVPSNFVLLCSRCHAEAPVTRNPTDMLDWIAKRPGWMVMKAQAYEAALSAAIGPDWQARMNAHDPAAVTDEMWRRQEHIGTHGAVFTASSLAYLARDALASLEASGASKEAA